MVIASPQAVQYKEICQEAVIGSHIVLAIGRDETAVQVTLSGSEPGRDRLELLEETSLAARQIQLPDLRRSVLSFDIERLSVSSPLNGAIPGQEPGDGENRSAIQRIERGA